MMAVNLKGQFLSQVLERDAGETSLQRRRAFLFGVYFGMILGVLVCASVAWWTS